MPYYIIFRDKTKVIVTKKQVDSIFGNSNKTGFFKIGDSIYSFSNVSKVLSKNEFYSEYPEQAPSQITNVSDFTGQGSAKKPFSPTKTRNTFALEQMIIGLKKYINSTPENPVYLNGNKHFYKGSPETFDLLASMEKKLGDILTEKTK